jgi:hypothetical protein
VAYSNAEGFKDGQGDASGEQELPGSFLFCRPLRTRQSVTERKPVMAATRLIQEASHAQAACLSLAGQQTGNDNSRAVIVA